MPKDFSRTRRVAEQVQRELAGVLRDEVNDPRVGMATISGVEVSRDLKHAKVFVTIMERKGEDPDATISALNQASAFLRHRLGERLVMRSIPSLRFFYDQSVKEGFRMDALIDEAVARDRGKHGDGDE